MKNFNEIIESKEILIRHGQDIINLLEVPEEVVVNAIVKEYNLLEDENFNINDIDDRDDILFSEENLSNNTILEDILKNQKHTYSDKYEYFELHYEYEVWDSDNDWEKDEVSSIWEVKFFNIKQN